MMRNIPARMASINILMKSISGGSGKSSGNNSKKTLPRQAAKPTPTTDTIPMGNAHRGFFNLNPIGLKTMTDDSFKIPAADVHEPIQIWLVRQFDKKIANYHLVELDGKCFYQHKARKPVMVCANCAEDCKRYFLEYSLPKGSLGYTLKCNRCRVEFSFDSDPSNATPVESDAET